VCRSIMGPLVDGPDIRIARPTLNKNINKPHRRNTNHDGQLGTAPLFTKPSSIYDSRRRFLNRRGVKGPQNSSQYSGRDNLDNLS
jgi:hypothetical protein